MFGELLLSFNSIKIGISYQLKKMLSFRKDSSMSVHTPKESIFLYLKDLLLQNHFVLLRPPLF